jgi:hypothetical protein
LICLDSRKRKKSSHRSDKKKGSGKKAKRQLSSSSDDAGTDTSDADDSDGKKTAVENVSTSSDERLDALHQIQCVITFRLWNYKYPHVFSCYISRKDKRMNVDEKKIRRSGDSKKDK